jgi:tRNA (cmo5U34)-methyltransferase
MNSPEPAKKKSSVEEIRRRFDDDVERFSNLNTGQSATVDAALAMGLLTEAAAVATPHAAQVLDVGCGAGNYTLKLLEHLPNLDVTLVDLSRPMLERAQVRIQPRTTGKVEPMQVDVREAPLAENSYDVILAAAVLHHLRSDEEWNAVVRKLYGALRTNGSIWVFDLVESSNPAIEGLMRRRYGEYLTALKDEAYRDHVFEYIEAEDSPRPLMFQLEVLKDAGFAEIDVLHKNSCFAAFGAVKR